MLSEIKRHIFLFILLCAGTLSCGKEDLAPQTPAAETETTPPAATGTVSISLGGPFTATRVANPASSVENACQRWALWIFDGDGDSVVYGTGLSGESIRKTVLVGSYTAIALVNYPESLVPANIQKKTDITGWVTSLSDNAAGSMLMYGEVSVDLEKDRTVNRTIDVRRLVSKVGVKKVSVAFENPYLAAKTTVLEAIYLTNLYRTSRLGADYSASELHAAEGAWYNVMGWREAGKAVPAMDALVGETAIQATLTPSAPHRTPHYFYAYPNAWAADDDTHDATWSKRSTRLVLQVAVGDKTYYYQVQIPAMGRNRIYVAEEITLRKLGSMDPEQDIPGAVDVVFSTSGLNWEDDVNVIEDS
jgi:hypothetical protein